MKKFQVRTTSILSQDAHAVVPWDDVALRFKAKPGRRVVCLEPSLCGHAGLVAEVDCSREALRSVGSKDPRRQTIEASIAEGEALCARVRRKGLMFVAGHGLAPTYGNVFTASDFIDRSEAERMLNFFLSAVGYSPGRFVWKRSRVLHEHCYTVVKEGGGFEVRSFPAMLDRESYAALKPEAL